MKPVSKYLFFFLLFLPGLAVAQWTPTSGPTENVNSKFLIEKGGVFFLTNLDDQTSVTRRRTYISYDTCQTWLKSDISSTGPYVIYNDTLIAGGGCLRQIYFDGDNWVEGENLICTLTNDLYASGDTLWIGSEEWGVMYSIDARNWFSATSETSNYPEEAYDFGTEDYFFKRSYAVTTSPDYIFSLSHIGLCRALRSDFSNWEVLDSDLPAEALDDIFYHDGKLYAGVNGDIYVSNNEGDSWFLSYSPGGAEITDFYEHNDSIFATTNAAGVYMTGAGVVWEPFHAGLTSLYTNTVVYGAGEYYCATETGVFEGLDYWNETGKIISSAVLQLTSNSNVIMARTARSGLWITNDEGDSWERTAGGLGLKLFGNIVEIDNQFYFTGIPDEGFPSNQKVFRSDETGESWELLTELPNYGDRYTLATDGISHLAAWEDGMGGSFHLSTDAGLTWETRNIPAELPYLTGMMILDNEIYITCELYGLYKSNDWGLTWYKTGDDLPWLRIEDFYPNGSTIYVNTDWGYLFRSENGGENWEPAISYGITGEPVDVTFDGDNVYAATKNKVYFSSDNGDNWENYSFGLPYESFNNYNWGSLEIVENVLYYGTNQIGVWKLPLSEVPVGTPTFEKPVLYAYPNPFSTNTQLNWGVNLSAEHQLVIYDVQGNLVYSNNAITGSDQTIEMSDIPAGIYFALLSGPEIGEPFTAKLVIE